VFAAAVFVAWLAWQANAPPRPNEARVAVRVPAEELLRQVRAQLTAPSLARSIEQPLVAEAQRMRSDARRAVDFLVARVSLPIGTRAPRD